MSKLHNAKSWYSLGDAVKRLAATLEEAVGFFDLLQFIVEEKIPLYCYLEGRRAEPSFPEGFIAFTRIKHERRPNKEQTLMGLYRIDLGINPSMKSSLLNLLLQPADGYLPFHTFVVQDDNGKFWQLLDYCKDLNGNNGDFIPTAIMPELQELVLKRTDLEKFEATLNEKSSTEPKPLHTRERETFLKLLIGIAVKKYGYNPRDARSAVIKKIADDLAECGINLDEDTVRNKLKEAAPLLPSAISAN